MNQSSTVRVKSGRKEIKDFLAGWVKRSRGLQDVSKVTPEQLFMIVGSNLGWDWDIDDVGRAPCRWTGEPSPLTGMYKFLAETLTQLLKENPA